MAVLGPLQKPLSALLSVKFGNFSFFVDNILQNYHMTIPMLQKYSPESAEHFKCLQSIYEVSRRYLQVHFQQTYFFENAIFYTRLRYFWLKEKLFRKYAIVENCPANMF